MSPGDAFNSLGWHARGAANMRENEDGTIEITGHLPRIVEVSDDLFREMIAEINELRKLRREREARDEHL